jgi:addiction module RelE/StbE family toxin
LNRALFEDDFLKAVKKHAAIKKAVERKIDQILQDPVALGEPLKANRRGYYSCHVKRNFIIIYLYCETCRKKGDQDAVACPDCAEIPDATVRFVLLGTHDDAYGI